MKVSYNYLPQEFSNSDKIFKEWKELISSSDFTLGRYIDKFEEKFSSYIGTKYCIATNNGTDALILALKSVGVGLNDEVVTVCNSFYATAGAIAAVNAKPIFCDCDDRYQICTKDLEKKITNKTKVIIPVHWGGASPDMKKIMKIANKYNLNVIEDACMGIGAKVFNKSPGTFGIVNAFSMHPLKSLNVMGDGGAVTTNNKKIYQWMKKYRNHGMINRDEIDFWGVNIRMQPLQAIVAIHGLKKLDSVIKKRKKNADILDRAFNENKLRKHIKVPSRPNGYYETYALYMILCKHRDQLKAYLEKKGIEVKIHYPVPLHLQKPSIKAGYKVGDFCNSESQAKNLLTLPVHQFLQNKDLKYMINVIKDFYKIS